MELWEEIIILSNYSVPNAFVWKKGFVNVMAIMLPKPVFSITLLIMFQLSIGTMPHSAFEERVKVHNVPSHKPGSTDSTFSQSISPEKVEIQSGDYKGG